MTTIRSCVEFMLASLCSLLLALFCPVVIGAAARIVFTPGSLVCTLVTLVCFTWGSRNFWMWWNQFQDTITRLPRCQVHRPKQVNTINW